MNGKYTSEEVRLEAERCGSGADRCDYDPVKNGMLTAYAERIEADDEKSGWICIDGYYSAQPIPMLLFCPKCHTQHIDKPDDDASAHPDGRESHWDNPPHRSHLCHSCGCIWRPADVPTTGVARIETRGTHDNWQ